MARLSEEPSDGLYLKLFEESGFLFFMLTYFAKVRFAVVLLIVDTEESDDAVSDELSELGLLGKEVSDDDSERELPDDDEGDDEWE